MAATSENIIEKVLGEACKNLHSKFTDAYIRKITPDEQPIKDDTDFMDWARHHPNLKVVETPVPDDILPDACLADVKVHSRGPDDALYDKNPELREKVARGNTFLKVGEQPWQCIVYALKKFTGGMGDDDDRSAGGNDLVWQRYFTKDIEEAENVIAVRKANGEAAHFSCRRIGKDRCICVGSKNVHMLLKKKSDIAKYEGERYRMATGIANAVFEFLEEIKVKKTKRLLDFLCATRLTAVMEILFPDHQHVEDLSYLDGKPRLQFITWTSTDLKAENELCVLPPNVAIDVAEYLGFPTLSYKFMTVPEADSHMLEIRKGYQFEGEVLYYMDRDDNVIGLLKKKTAWYILCRAIREKVRNAICSKRHFDKIETQRKISKRILEIQKWLHLSDENTQKWKDLGKSFLDWVVQEKGRGSLQPRDVADLFPVTWKKFLEDNEDNELSDLMEYCDTIT